MLQPSYLNPGPLMNRTLHQNRSEPLHKLNTLVLSTPRPRHLTTREDHTGSPQPAAHAMGEMHQLRVNITLLVIMCDCPNDQNLTKPIWVRMELRCSNILVYT